MTGVQTCALPILTSSTLLPTITWFPSAFSSTLRARCPGCPPLTPHGGTDHPSRRLAMSEHAALFARERYSWDAIAPQMADLYAGLH